MSAVLRDIRFSQHFLIPATQPYLDFVDVFVDRDVPLFLDPTALLDLKSDFGHDCIALIQDFFGTILQLVRSGQRSSARKLLSVLSEPNDVRLGYSTGHPRGHGLGPTSAGWIADALADSTAVATGLLQDLEDTILMIEGVNADLVSDIAANLIRGELIEYTRQQCQTWGVPLMPDVGTGILWSPTRKDWTVGYAERPIAGAGPLTLVPKVLVRRHLEYDYEDYYRHYVLPFLVDQELEGKTSLVTVLKGHPHVYKKDVEEKYGSGKGVVVDVTRTHPEILTKFRRDVRERKRVRRPALMHSALADAVADEYQDPAPLAGLICQLQPGDNDAHRYESAIGGFLAAVFYPYLTRPVTQQKIHQGRKRVDITFENSAHEGFFDWLAQNYRAPYVFVECKNYGTELGNPELDQMVGRFSDQRGTFGIIVCRRLANREAFEQRCRDTAADGRGFIVVLTDDDLAPLAAESAGGVFSSLKERFRSLVMRA